jgi:hypothetical protein
VKKDIVIFPARGPIEGSIIIAGAETPMLDVESKTLVIIGEEGSYLTFNWDNVLSYGVSNADEIEQPANV